MEQIDIDSDSLPAVRVMLNKMGYELVSTVMVKVTNTPYPYITPVLYARPVIEGQPHIAIMLGNIGWDPNGNDAYIDYKIFEVGTTQPETLEYWSVKTMALYWSWKERYGYNKEPHNDLSIKPESVHWQPLMTVSNGRSVQVK